MPVRPSDTGSSFVEGSPQFSVNWSVSESNPAPVEDSLTLALGLSESNDVETETVAATAWLWLFASVGTTNVTSPGNANGINDGNQATCTTVLLGASTSQLTSNCGYAAHPNLPYTNCTFRGWFDASTPLLTSTASIVAHATDASYADITIYSLSALGGSFNSDGGTFTFDLYTAGVNTLAKLQATQILFKTSDLLAGTTPAVLKVDAARLEVTGAI